MTKSQNLITDKRFWPIFWVQFLGAFNDNIFKNALVILIAYKSYTLIGLDSSQMVALCGGVFILPFFLFSATAGSICDKFPKHRLVKVIKYWEIIVMLIGALGLFTSNIVILIGTLFFMGLQSTIFGPIKFSVLPELIDEDNLVKANAYVELGTFMAILLGTILGGILISLGDIGQKLVAITVISVAIIGTALSYFIQKLVAQNPDLKIDIGIFRPTYNILKITKEVPSVFQSILGISWFWFFGAALLSIFPIYVKETLHADESVATLFLSIFSIGVGIGSIICEKMSHERLELGLVPLGSIFLSLFTIDLYIVGTPSFIDLALDKYSISSFIGHFESYRIMFDLFMLSIFSGLFIVPLYTFIQQRSSSDSRSRVIAGNNIINAMFMVASSLFLTLLYSIDVTPVTIFLILALLNIIVASYIYTVIPEFFYRFGCYLVSFFIYRLEVQGHKNIPKEGACVLVCNHVSFVDWFIISAAIKRPARFVMHYSFMKIPLLSFFFKGAGVIPIAGSKENQEILDKAFDEIAAALKNGEIICIFPEGKITADGKLNSFKPGIEKIINRTPVPVVPMCLKGLWGSFFSRKWNGKALSNPKIIVKTIWSKIHLQIEKPWAAEKVDAAKLEQQTLDMLKS